MDEPDGDGGPVPANRWKPAHDALHEDTMALMRVVGDRGRIEARLRELDEQAGQFSTPQEKVRFVSEEQEAFEKESRALERLIDEVGTARENCLAEHVAGREDAERRAREASLLLRPEMSGEEKQAVADRLVSEVAAAKAVFDEKHTKVFLALHDRVRSWLDRYDPVGTLRLAERGDSSGA